MFWAKDIAGRNDVIRMMRDVILNAASIAEADGNLPVRVKLVAKVVRKPRSSK